MRITQEDGESVFEGIDDETEFEKVLNYFESQDYDGEDGDDSEEDDDSVVEINSKELHRLLKELPHQESDN
jgi:hypothetical protein